VYNLGQIIYDKNAKELLMWCGIIIEGGGCETAFIDGDGKVIAPNEKNGRFIHHTCLRRCGRPYMGPAVVALALEGYYHGILDYEDPEVIEAAIEAIQATQQLINEHGLHDVVTAGPPPGVEFHIGEPVCKEE
jgi:hypothetical protein